MKKRENSNDIIKKQKNIIYISHSWNADKY